MPMLDYSRFDNIVDSDDDLEEPNAEGMPPEFLRALAEQAEQQAAAPPPPRPPDNVLDDLEDYFERWDARRSEGVDPSESASRASVERFEEEDFEQLDRRKGGLGAAECAICLACGSDEDLTVTLPCAAKHCFHEDCAKAWFERNTTCPLCRVDVRNLVRAASPRQPAPPSPRNFGFTRDGGVIARYDPTPPSDLPRPAYIPPELHTVAELVEIDYPERGVARVWRVPR